MERVTRKKRTAVDTNETSVTKSAPKKARTSARQAKAKAEEEPVVEPVPEVVQPEVVEPEASTSTSAPAPGDDASDAEEEEALEAVDPVEGRASDLYLDTINRNALDFDFEKVCSVSTSDINIYGCLVCGKYFQGRGRKSYAYAHSIHEDHHVFINLDTTKVYVLPDGYLVSDPSLEDIAYVLKPTFTRQQLAALSDHKLSYDLSSKAYLPGYVGLNNIKKHDHMNVVTHALLHVRPLRDFLLLYNSDEQKNGTELVRRLSALAKKLWNPRLFKAQVSPHEFLQEVGRSSDGRFRLETQGDPVEFIGWLLNKLHRDLGGTKKKNSSIIFSTFQGELRVEDQQVLVKSNSNDEKPKFDIGRDTKTTVSPFLLLAVDLPAPPLFQDTIEKNIIPQVNLATILAKFDGHKTHETAGQLRRYKCQRLPRYAIFHFKRFTKNQFVEEKNPTIINFPLRGLDMKDYLDSPDQSSSTLYDLVANVTHESAAGTTRDKEATVWKVYLRAGDGENEKWLMVQDLIVEETRKEMIFLGESTLQIWERRDRDTTRDDHMQVDASK